jgi:hypothetical protein
MSSMQKTVSAAIKTTALMVCVMMAAVAARAMPQHPAFKYKESKLPLAKRT